MHALFSRRMPLVRAVSRCFYCTVPKVNGQPADEVRMVQGGKPGATFKEKRPLLTMQPLESFAEDALSQQGRNCLKSMGVKGLFPVQVLSFEPIRSGKNVQIKAHTGSGKTLAYIIPIVERMLKEAVPEPREPNVCVIVPSWELTAQVAQEFKTMSNLMLSVTELTGGKSFQEEVSRFENPVDVVIGTQGRIRHHISEGTFTFRNLKVLVIDEADLLTHEFKAFQFLKTILDGNETSPQTIVVSALRPPWVKQLPHTHPAFEDPTVISLTSATEPSTSPNISHHYLVYPHILKAPMVAYLVAQHLLDTEHRGKVLVFCNRRSECERLAEDEGLLKVVDGNVSRLVSDASAGKRARYERDEALAEFIDGRSKVLVASDVAGRGVNVEGLTLVINVGIPRSSSDYVYRAGRVGRGGKTGDVVTLMNPGDEPVLQQLKLATKAPLTHLALPPQHVKEVLAQSNSQKKMRSRFTLFSPEDKRGLFNNDREWNRYKRRGQGEGD